MECLSDDLLYTILSKIPEEYTATVEVCKQWKHIQSMEYFKTECTTCIGHRYALFSALHNNHRRCLMYLLEHFKDKLATSVPSLKGYYDDQFKDKFLSFFLDYLPNSV